MPGTRASQTLQDEETSEVKGVLGKGEKIQSLDLVERREGTVMVLSKTIANLVCDFLFSHAPSIHPYAHPDSSPPFSTHSSSTYMVYSLDQHGISLNPPLYSRCEPKLPATPGATKGALIAIKDARDAIFGVWMGDGLWLEGGYYGSGEL
jgi:hypothetical protein